VLDVPVGTLALDSDGALIADLDRPGADSVVAQGGLGGRGNVHFKSSRRQAPDYSEPGIKGEERALTLDLKLIAEVGLVGPPNAGKSSLLAALTAAHPKVAPYPFTTLDPELGVAEISGARIVIADIPGLIEGAAAGAGLGLRFLRHVERTEILVYVLDGNLLETASFRAYDWLGAGMNVAVAPRIGLPIAADARTLKLKAHKRVRVIVARFRDAGGGSIGLKPSIAWGDGTNASGTVLVRGNGVYDVRGTKRYARPGRYTVTVTVRASDGRTSVARSRVTVTRR